MMWKFSKKFEIYEIEFCPYPSFRMPRKEFEKLEKSSKN